MITDSSIDLHARGSCDSKCVYVFFSLNRCRQGAGDRRRNGWRPMKPLSGLGLPRLCFGIIMPLLIPVFRRDIAVAPCHLYGEHNRSIISRHNGQFLEHYRGKPSDKCRWRAWGVDGSTSLGGDKCGWRGIGHAITVIPLIA